MKQSIGFGKLLHSVRYTEMHKKYTDLSQIFANYPSSIEHGGTSAIYIFMAQLAL